LQLSKQPRNLALVVLQGAATAHCYHHLLISNPEMAQVPLKCWTPWKKAPEITRACTCRLRSATCQWGRASQTLGRELRAKSLPMKDFEVWCSVMSRFLCM